MFYPKPTFFTSLSHACIYIYIRAYDAQNMYWSSINLAENSELPIRDQKTGVWCHSCYVNSSAYISWTHYNSEWNVTDILWLHSEGITEEYTFLFLCMLLHTKVLNKVLWSAWSPRSISIIVMSGNWNTKCIQVIPTWWMHIHDSIHIY
jgi:hypothetical protein